MKRALHSLVALVVALPLGVGGLCCCLAGHDDGAAVVAVEETHACCSGGEAAPAAPAEDQGECDCPGLDQAVFAKGVAAPDALASVTSELPVAPPAPSAASRLLAAVTVVAPMPSPPPRLPLDRTPSVLRC